MSRIFLSYRRTDSAGWAGRLYDSLQRLLPSAQLFMDVENIPPGVDFERFIGDAVGNCDLLLTLIGPQWLDARDGEGNRRLDDAADYTRLEVEAALKRDIRVIPVLVGGARMPTAAQLPESLRPLVKRQSFELHDRGWEEGCQRLAQAIEQATAPAGPAPRPPRPGTAPGVPAGGGGRRPWLWTTVALSAVTIALAIGFAVGLSRRGALPESPPGGGQQQPPSTSPTQPVESVTPPTAPPVTQPPQPSLLDLGLEGTWSTDAQSGPQPLRIAVERDGQTIRLARVLPDGRRVGLGRLAVEPDRVLYDYDTEGFSVEARATAGSAREWRLRLLQGSGGCTDGGGAVQASPDLHRWDGHLSCRGPREERVDFTASLAADGGTVTLTAGDAGGQPKSVVLRREP